MIRKWDITDLQLQRTCVQEILQRLKEQNGTEFGILAAEDIIEIVAHYVGPQAYNLGLEDARQVLQAKLNDTEVELDVLKVTI